MLANIYKMKVDLKRSKVFSTPTLIQYDSVQFHFYIYDNGIPFDLSGFTRVEVAHHRPDDVIVAMTGEILTDAKGEQYVSYTYQGSEMAVTGLVATSLSILSDTQKVSIMPFHVDIIRDLRDGIVTTAVQESGLLQTYSAQIEDLKVELNTAIQSANTVQNDVNAVKDAAIQATSDAQEQTSLLEARLLEDWTGPQGEQGIQGIQGPAALDQNTATGVGYIKVWTGTLAEYEALTAIDPLVVYHVRGV